MSTLFASPWFLLPGLLYAGALGAWIMRLRRSGFSRRRRRSLMFHAGAALCLLLAAAGLQIPALSHRLRVAVVADVSDSILDRSAQTARMHELLQVLPPDRTDVAVAVFAAAAGTERRWEALTASAFAPPHQWENRTLELRDASPLPDLQRLKTQLNTTATDIGATLDYARGLFPSDAPAQGRGILLLSDFRDTRGQAARSAAALSGSGIDLLASPAIQGQSQDAYVSSVRVPDLQQVGRALPVEVTVASLTPCNLRIVVSRTRLGQEPKYIGAQTVALEPQGGGELRKTVRFVDAEVDAPGVAVYKAELAADQPLVNDVRTNNELTAAVRIVGTSHWAVLTRPGSTLERLASDAQRPLGVKTAVFHTGALPARAAKYQEYDGILVDGLSAAELPDAPLKAIAEAAAAGRGVVALGGQTAFGAGGHPRDGCWEQLLPAQMTPEDDRTRAVLFIIDVSESMRDPVGRVMPGAKKIEFAREQLARAVRKLKPLDRLGLITFADSARLAAPLSTEPTRQAFIGAVQKAAIEHKTNLLAALNTTKDVLKDDNSEERLIILLSDGEDTSGTPREEILKAAEQLCPPPAKAGEPPRTALYTFGIGVTQGERSESGEKMMIDLARTGRGEYAPEFAKFAERLERTFEESKKEFYVRRETFAVQARSEHPLIQGRQWPELSFRNRVKAKPHAETLLFSRQVVPASVPAAPDASPTNRPDPLLVLSGSEWPGMARCALLALSLEGDAGSALLSSEARTLLPALLDWTEAKAALPAGLAVSAECMDGEKLELEVRVREPASGLPLNGRKFAAELIPLAGSLPLVKGEIQRGLPLHASAPGLYRADIPVAPQTIYRLTLSEDGRNVAERLVSTPYSAELRRFGTERSAMHELLGKAGGDARAIEHPQDLARWAEACQASRVSYSLRPWLLALGLLLLLAEFGTRGTRL